MNSSCIDAVHATCISYTYLKHCLKRTNSLTQSNSIVNDHCHKVIVFNHLCMISYLFNPRPWKLLLLPLSVGMLKPSYRFLIYGFSPQDNGWVRCGGYWPTKSAALHFIHVIIPLRGRAHQSDYLDFRVLKTIHFKRSKQKVKRINAYIHAYISPVWLKYW